MLVDPRPYTYEYRTPRLSNPTFQSSNLYESLYHRNSYQVNDYFTPVKQIRRYVPEKVENGVYAGDYGKLERNRSMNLYERKNLQEPRKDNPQKYQSNYKLPSIKVQHRQEELVLPKIPEPVHKRQGFERFGVYERQQKAFDIINYKPRQNEANKLRNYPKLTLEDKLIERGTYHSFNQERL